MPPPFHLPSLSQIFALCLPLSLSVHLSSCIKCKDVTQTMPALDITNKLCLLCPYSVSAVFKTLLDYCTYINLQQTFVNCRMFSKFNFTASSYFHAAETAISYYSWFLLQSDLLCLVSGPPTCRSLRSARQLWLGWYNNWSRICLPHQPHNHVSTGRSTAA